MTPHYTDDLVTLYHGDCLDVLRELDDASVDAVVTDPPYGLSDTSAAQVAETVIRWTNGERDYIPSGAGFMGKAWDAFVPPVAVWDDCLRVLKPGGHLLSFAGSRTVDLMALGIRLAGFEIRDQIQFLYGSGFPKSLDVSKAIDKAAGAERSMRVNERWADKYPNGPGGNLSGDGRSEHYNQAKRIADGPLLTSDPATPDAERWQGWGTALKPAHEPIVVARKPLIGTVAANVLAHGTGAINVDGCRVGDEVRVAAYTSLAPAHGNRLGAPGTAEARRGTQGEPQTYTGRWPANVVLDEYTAALLDEQSGVAGGGFGVRGGGGEVYGGGKGYAGTLAETGQVVGYGDTGGASRFFYTAKAGSDERPRVDGIAHPTVKPLDLMRWLVRLVTPPGGVVLEPFAGSGTTLEACVIEGFSCIGIEREADYIRLIEARLSKPIQPDMFGGMA